MPGPADAWASKVERSRAGSRENSPGSQQARHAHQPKRSLSHGPHALGLCILAAAPPIVPFKLLWRCQMLICGAASLLYPRLMASELSYQDITWGGRLQPASRNRVFHLLTSLSFPERRELFLFLFVFSPAAHLSTECTGFWVGTILPPPVSPFSVPYFGSWAPSPLPPDPG